MEEFIFTLVVLIHVLNNLSIDEEELSYLNFKLNNLK